MDDIVEQLQRALPRPVPAGVEGSRLECREDGLDTVNVRIAVFGFDKVEFGLERCGRFLKLAMSMPDLPSQSLPSFHHHGHLDPGTGT